MFVIIIKKRKNEKHNLFINYNFNFIKLSKELEKDKVNIIGISLSIFKLVEKKLLINLRKMPEIQLLCIIFLMDGSVDQNG